MTTHEKPADAYSVALTVGLDAGASGRRVRTVEYDPGYGWIARNPFTGREIPEDGFRWVSRSVARSVVLECKLLRASNAELCGVRSTSERAPG